MKFSKLLSIAAVSFLLSFSTLTASAADNSVEFVQYLLEQSGGVYRQIVDACKGGTGKWFYQAPGGGPFKPVIPAPGAGPATPWSPNIKPIMCRIAATEEEIAGSGAMSARGNMCLMAALVLVHEDPNDDPYTIGGISTGVRPIHFLGEDWLNEIAGDFNQFISDTNPIYYFFPRPAPPATDGGEPVGADYGGGTGGDWGGTSGSWPENSCRVLIANCSPGPGEKTFTFRRELYGRNIEDSERTKLPSLLKLIKS